MWAKTWYFYGRVSPNIRIVFSHQNSQLGYEYSDKEFKIIQAVGIACNSRHFEAERGRNSGIVDTVITTLRTIPF